MQDFENLYVQQYLNQIAIEWSENKIRGNFENVNNNEFNSSLFKINKSRN